ncbi:MAG: GNAT family N-acetyltransferase [Planctomycetota bacterium]
MAGASPADAPLVIVTERLTLVPEAPRAKDGALAHTIRLTRGEETVGRGVLAPLEGGDWRLEITLEEGARGFGFAREAGRALLGHAFGEVGARRVAAFVDPRDEAAGRLSTRLGFHDQGPAGPEAPGRRRLLTWRAPGPRPPKRRRR